MMRHKYLRSEYERTYKAYDDIYAFMRKTNVGSVRMRKAKNERHTPFAWEDEDEVFDVPSVPSNLDWAVILDRNVPRPSDPPAFKQKHLKFVAAYEENMRMKKAKKGEKKLKQSTSPKGSTSCDFVLSRGSNSLTKCSSRTSVQSMPASMPSHMGSPPPPGGKNVARKAVQTPSDWSKIDDNQSEKAIQTKKNVHVAMKTPSKTSVSGSSAMKKKSVAMKTPSKTSISGPVAAKSPVPKFTIVSNINDPSKDKYIVSKVDKQYFESDQPFTGFGTGNKNTETARKMTANVRSPCNVYPTAVRAGVQLKLRRENKMYESPRAAGKPEFNDKRKKAKQWKEKVRKFDSEYVSNYTAPDQVMHFYRRKQAQKIAEKACKACGVLRKGK